MHPRMLSSLAALLLLPLPLPALAAKDTLESRTLKIQGLERSYRLYRPSTPSQAPRALLVALHGGYGSGSTLEKQTGLDQLAEREGFFVVYPDGFRRSWNAGACCGPAQRQNVDDVGFVRAVIADIAQRYPVDRQRIYGTGFSNGAMLLNRIACEAPSTFSAVAPVAGNTPLPGCANARAPAALLLQGRDDERVPWAGGSFEGQYRPPIRDMAAQLASHNICSQETETLPAPAGVECQHFKGCAADGEVRWCVIEGLGHQWAGGQSFLRPLLGRNRSELSASEMVWEFLAPQRRTSDALP